MPARSTLITLVLLFAFSAALWTAVRFSPDAESTADGLEGFAIGRWNAPGQTGRKAARAEYFHMLLRDPATDRIPARIRQLELAYARTLPAKPLGKASTSWMEAGPTDVGGRTRALGVDLRNPDVIVAGGASGGIWKSIDGGENWDLRSSMTQQLDVTSLAQDPRPGNRDTWYYASGEYVGSAGGIGYESFYYGSGIYKSTDNGETWEQIQDAGSPIKDDTQFDFVSKVVVSPVSGSVFLASNNFGILRSEDGGDSFDLVLGSLNGHTWSDVAVASDGGLAVVVSGGLNTSPEHEPGVYRSTDDGLTWEPVEISEFPTSSSRSVIATAPSNPAVAYVLAQHDPPLFFKVNLAAGSVDDRSANLPAFEDDGESSLDFQNGFNMVVAVKPDDEAFVLVGGTSLFRSRDGFTTKVMDKEETWIGGYDPGSPIGEYPNHHPDQHVLVFDPDNPSRMWSGHDGGVSVIDDVTTTEATVPWIDRNSGYNVTQFYTVAISDKAEDMRLVGGTQDNGSPYFLFDGSNAGASVDASTGDGSFAYLGEEYAYVSAQLGGVIRRAYVGDSLMPDMAVSTIISPETLEDALFINPFAVDPSDEDVMYFPAVDLLWRNDRLSEIPDFVEGTMVGWTLLDDIEVPDSYTITSLNVSTSNPSHVLYLGMSSQSGPPRIARLDDAHTATDGELDVSVPNSQSGAYVHDIAINPLDGDEIIVVYSNYNVVGLYHSLDGGQTYSAVEGNLEGTAGDGPSLRAAAILPLENQTLYFVGTSTGVYATGSLNGESTIWEQEGVDALGHAVVTALDARTSDGTVAAGTHGRGIFLRNDPTLNIAPVARFSAEPLFSDPLMLTFDASASSDANGDELSYTWDFGDGSTDSGRIVSHRYASIGTYTVKLRVEDPSGLNEETSREIDVRSTITLPIRSYDPSLEINKDFLVDLVEPIDTGFIYGPNIRGDRAKATLLTLPEGMTEGKLSEVTVLWRYKRGDVSDQQYALSVYDGDPDRGPAQAIWSASYPLIDVNADADLSTSDDANVYEIDPPITVREEFFVAVEFESYTQAEWGLTGLASTEPIFERILEVWDRSPSGVWEITSDAWFSGPRESGAHLIIDALVHTGGQDATARGEPEVPGALVLDQNYPNPFNPSTTIHYELPQAGSISLDVYSVLGRRVATLVRGIQPAGRHAVRFDASLLPSGVYFYRLEAGGQVREKQMLLVR